MLRLICNCYLLQINGYLWVKKQVITQHSKCNDEEDVFSENAFLILNVFVKLKF